MDHVNFNAKQTANFDRLPVHLRKKLSRIDTRDYVLQLEKKLTELGVDVAAMQSDYKYKKNSFQKEAMGG